MLTYEQVFEIFKDFLAAEPDVEIVPTKRGYLHIVWDWNTLYCEGGRLAKGPEDLFDMLLEDCQSSFELELTKGRRELTVEDSEQARARCRPYLERRKEAERE